MITKDFTNYIEFEEMVRFKDLFILAFDELLTL